ncbi:MAG: hypothetical protein ABSC55_10395 [Syntrophorhabdales bacterium]|jgi:hypothetical protein
MEKRHGFTEYYGSSDLRIDILLKNLGLRDGVVNVSPEISHLYVIYPNCLFEIENGKDPRLMIHVDILDDSEELHSENENNYPYHQPGNALRYKQIGHDNWEIRIIQPHPNTLAPRELTGYVRGAVEISAAMDVFDKLQEWDILTQNNISLLKLDFAHPISKDEGRLMRLRIKPRATSRSKHKFFPRWYNVLLTDRLFYSYEIFGPYDVQYRAGSILKSYRYEIEDVSNKGKSEGTKEEISQNPGLGHSQADDMFDQYAELEKITTNIIDKLGGHVGNPLSTKIMDWRINIQAGTFNVLRNIREYGAAKICGANRNVLRDEPGGGVKLVSAIGDGPSRTLYQWKTGRLNVCPKEAAVSTICQGLLKSAQCEPSDEALCYPAVGNFTIAFDCQKSYWPRLMLGYIAFVYALYNLTIWLGRSLLKLF